jgi:crotonobetainyl-CoA:carnitine CoA-transferase CaiB-like acyl-CoA transferase
VIWVEPPGGDRCRDTLASAYSVFNRGKRSIVLDLGSTAERDQLLELLDSADVFVQAWRPGVADRLGLDYGTVHARVPGLVYCSISGFGTDGPFRDVPGYESLVDALVGVMAAQTGHRAPPIFEGLHFAGTGAAYLAAIGTLAALYRREDDGVGRHVQTSLMDGALAYLSMFWSDTDAGGAPPMAAATVRMVTRSFVCEDDEYLGVHTGAVGAFGRLMHVLGLDERIPPSEDGMDMTIALTDDQREILENETHKIFASKPRSHWVDRLLDADVCAIEHLHPGEVFDQPQPRHNGMVVDVDDPMLGPVQQVAPPVKFAGTPSEPPQPAPTIGRDTDAVLGALGSQVSAPQEPRALDDRPLLDGVKVLDLGAFYAGPYASRLLADLGADVIKVEPVGGDQLRGLASVFRSAQAGKRSIAANLKDRDLTPALEFLVGWADVLHHNLRPGAAERLGLDYDQVRALSPDIIYMYAPGWGSSGPHMSRQSFAPMMSGYVGAGYECAGQFNPPLFPAANEDPGTGLAGAVGVLMALLHRRRGGHGQYLECPQLNATMAHLAHIVRTADGTVLGAGRLDPLQLGVGPLERLYETADGWICLVARDRRCLAGLSKVVGFEIPADAHLRFSTVDYANAEALEGQLTAAFGCRATADWLDELHAVDVPACEPSGPSSITFLRDPANRRSGRVAECEDEIVGHVREIALLLRVSDAAVRPHRLAPALGAHTDSILSWAGYEPSKIAELLARNAIR